MTERPEGGDDLAAAVSDRLGAKSDDAYGASPLKRNEELATANHSEDVQPSTSDSQAQTHGTGLDELAMATGKPDSGIAGTRESQEEDDSNLVLANGIPQNVNQSESHQSAHELPSSSTRPPGSKAASPSLEPTAVTQETVPTDEQKAEDARRYLLDIHMLPGGG